ncbi:SAFB-like transcription modulator [Gouania willdenowi]|uniref:SAFB-like transcription modulator n=1 Tax=Gouania willdenowi TaxID=441366 RepID=UPI0010567132|nr:SAFB-like transcription modulator [Gouania willdenowi]
MDQLNEKDTDQDVSTEESDTESLQDDDENYYLFTYPDSDEQKIIDQDYEFALSLTKDQEEEYMQWVEQSRGLSDLELAKTLQEEEYDQEPQCSVDHQDQGAQNYQEPKENGSEKDVTESDDGTRESSKAAPSEDTLVHSETEPEVVPEPELEPEVVKAEADSEPEPGVDEDTDPEIDAEAEPEVEPEAEPEAELAVMDSKGVDSCKEAEEDHLLGLIQNEDATLDFNGDNLLETGEFVKPPDPEVEKSSGKPEASVEMGPDDELKEEEILTREDGETDDESLAEPPKKKARKASKNAKTGDEKKNFRKKGSSTTGASGRAKSYVTDSTALWD